MNKKIRLPNGKWIELNDQQMEALDLLQNWIKDRSAMVCRLSGFAGTGKTTIVKETIAWYSEKYRWERPIAVTAPTHKAKKEISRTTGLKGKTIQSLLGLAPNTDVLYFDINNPEFSVKNKPGIEYYSIIVVDEASMLNKDLYEMLKTQSSKFGVKLLFMCDIAQLPPVKEVISPVVIDKLQYSYQLTKVERQAGDNPLMLVYDNIRNNIDSKKDAFKHTSNIIVPPMTEEEYELEKKPIEQGISFITELPKFGGKVVTAFNSPEFKEDGNHCKMLCWTNDRVAYWNNSVRKVLLQEFRKTTDETDPMFYQAEILIPGELLMAYTSGDSGLINATEYVVRKIEYKEEAVEYGYPISGELGLTAGRPFSQMVAMYDVVLTDVDNPLVEVNCKIIEPNTENYLKFLKAFEWYLNEGKFKKKWPQYFLWKSEYMLLTDIRAVGGKLICKKDLDYAYAITIHKSQGSTYDQVFLDELDVDKNYNHIERNKLKYVALSRPRHKATVFTGKID